MNDRSNNHAGAIVDIPTPVPMVGTSVRLLVPKNDRTGRRQYQRGQKAIVEAIAGQTAFIRLGRGGRYLIAVELSEVEHVSSR